MYLYGIWVFIEDSGQGHVDVFERLEHKSVGFIILNQITAPPTSQLRLETARQASTTVRGSSTVEFNSSTQVGMVVAMRLRS